MDYLKIKYSNSCDLGGSLFNVPDNPFYYTCFLPVDLGPNTYEIVDEGREDGEKNFVSDFKKLIKKYSFVCVVPEYLYDSLSYAQLHDYVYVTLKNEETARAFNFSCELNEWSGNIAKITVSFHVDYLIKYGCCNNEITYQRCVECSTSINVLGLITDTSDIFLHPVMSMVFQGSYYLVSDAYGRYSLYQFLNQNINGSYTPTWTLIEPKDYALCFTVSGIAYKFYYNGSFWLRYLALNEVTNSGTLINIKGYTLPNTWVQCEKSLNNSTWSNAGLVTNGNTFATAGVNVSGLTVGVLYYFRFLMYNNNCNYGYSDTISIVKS